VITIGDSIPTDGCIRANAHALARYAAICREQDLLPIVEPEVLMDADNSIETCYDATSRTLHAVFDELFGQHVDVTGTLLKPNMVISGKGSPAQADARRIAELTIEAFKRHVPAAVPGIVFLSGGQSEVEATQNLNEINRIGGPWPLSFSYGRALQASALEAWRGDLANVEAGQQAFAHRARMNSLAVAGEWNAELEQPVTA
jgi:fructose-bisphosphate aldolase class I